MKRRYNPIDESKIEEAIDRISTYGSSTLSETNGPLAKAEPVVTIPATANPVSDAQAQQELFHRSTPASFFLCNASPVARLDSRNSPLNQSRFPL